MTTLADWRKKMDDAVALIKEGKLLEYHRLREELANDAIEWMCRQHGFGYFLLPVPPKLLMELEIQERLTKGEEDDELLPVQSPPPATHLPPTCHSSATDVPLFVPPALPTSHLIPPKNQDTQLPLNYATRGALCNYLEDLQLPLPAIESVQKDCGLLSSYGIVMQETLVCLRCSKWFLKTEGDAFNSVCNKCS